MMARSLLGRVADTFSAVPRVTNESPVPFARTRAGWSTGVGARADMGSQLRAYGSVGTLLAIVGRLANATSAVEWKLWRSAASGLEDDRIEVTSHAALDLWRKPNPFFFRQLYVETSQQHLDLAGESYWLVVSAMGIPLELWPVRPDRMTPEPHPTEYLSRWIYNSPDGEKIPLEHSEVIQLRTPDPDNAYRGISPVGALMRDIESTSYAADWSRNFFINGARPGGIVEFPTTLSDPEFERFNARWGEQHKGVGNAHRVALLEAGAKWVDRSYSPKDLDFAELRRLSDEQIRRAYAFPKPMLGDVEDVNRANAEAGKTIMAESHTVPRVERIRGALNERLLPMFGSTARGLEFDYVSPVPADRAADDAERASKALAWLNLIKGGAHPDDAAAAVGLPLMRTVPRPTIDDREDMEVPA